MSKHVSLVCKSCFYHMRDFSRIRRLLSKSVAVTLANALVGSRLDYCNSLMYGITKKQFRRLQAIQNTLCRIISHLPKCASTSHARKLLHWLPVEYRVKFKLLVITCKALNTQQPPYLTACLNEYSCNRTTRRSNPDNKFLNIPVYTHKTHKSKHHFDCSFEIARVVMNPFNMNPFIELIHELILLKNSRFLNLNFLKIYVSRPSMKHTNNL